MFWWEPRLIMMSVDGEETGEDLQTNLVPSSNKFSILHYHEPSSHSSSGYTPYICLITQISSRPTRMAAFPCLFDAHNLIHYCRNVCCNVNNCYNTASSTSSEIWKFLNFLVSHFNLILFSRCFMARILRHVASHIQNK